MRPVRIQAKKGGTTGKSPSFGFKGWVFIFKTKNGGNKMKKLSRLLALLMAMAIVFALAGCGSSNTASSEPSASPSASESAAPSDSTAPETAEKNFKIGILQYVEHPALDASREGFVQALADNGYVDGQNITIDLQNSQADPGNLQTICQRFVGNNEDLILAIATPAVQSIAAETTTIPILGTAVTDYVGAKLVNSNEAPGGNISGTSDMNPVKDQMDLLVKLVPDAKTIGILYTSSEENSIIQANLVKEYCTEHGLAVVEATVTSSNDVQQVSQSLVNKADAIYIPTDNVLASAMPIVGEIMTEAKIPTICGESNMVLSGGLATYGVDYYNLGYQTGEMAVRILKGEATTATMPIEFLEKCEFAINGDVAEAIGVTIPADLADAVVYPSKES
jgi:putative ABC transport system substrate-binding protein